MNDGCDHWAPPDQYSLLNVAKRSGACKVGQPITVIVEVEVESERLDLIDASRRKFIAAPEVQQCYYVTGEMDFVLIVTVPTMTEYEAFTRRMFFANQNVKRFRTMVAMDRVKVGLSLTLK